MIRKLIIIRHGKSSWDAVMDDIDRPLTERGVQASYDMAERLKKSANMPEIIFTSPANRAMHTAMIMARVWQLPAEQIHVKRQLYLPDLDDIREVICEFPDEVHSAAIYGHNPGFTSFIKLLTGDPIDNVPTAGLAVVNLEMDSWNDIYAPTVKEYAIDYPKKAPPAK